MTERARFVAVTGAASGLGAALLAQLRAAGQDAIGIDLRGSDVDADLGDEPGRAGAIEAVLDRGVEGPTDAERAAGSYRNFAIARNAAGDAVASVARGPEGYTLTALSAFDATRRAARGEGKAGYQTASSAFGPAFFTSLEGCRIEDIAVPEVRPR